MTTVEVYHILAQAKCDDPELVSQAIKELRKFFKEDGWEAWNKINYTHSNDDVQTNCADAYCLGWLQGQAHLLKFFTKQPQGTL